MITIFNRKELTLVSDVERLSKIRHILASNHIDYKIRFSTPVPGGGRYNSGTFGKEGPCYIIHVKKNNYDEAMFAIKNQSD